MNKILTLLSLFIFFAPLKSFAQQNPEEAKLRYQMGIEEYEKANFKEATRLLESTITLDSNSLLKSSYYLSKIYESFLFTANSLEYDYDKCLYYVDCYLKRGKDEERKTELRKIKIRVTDDYYYKVFKSFDNMTLQQAFDNVAENLRAQNLNWQWLTNYQLQTWEVDILENPVSVYLQLFDFSTADTFSGKTFFNKNSYNVLIFYKNINKFEKFFKSDLDNFNHGITTTHFYVLGDSGKVENRESAYFSKENLYGHEAKVKFDKSIALIQRTYKK